jgi:hypothetical protein
VARDSLSGHCDHPLIQPILIANREAVSVDDGWRLRCRIPKSDQKSGTAN